MIDLVSMIPTFMIEIPSTKKVVKMRPFLVKEEKMILMSQEANTAGKIELLDTIFKNCILSVNDPDVITKKDIDAFTTFDYFYIMLNLKGKSKGEVIKMISQGDPESECPSCIKDVPFEIRIDDIQVQFNKNHKKKIVLDKEKNFVINFKYVPFKEVFKLEVDDKLSDIEKETRFQAMSIESIEYGDEVTSYMDMTIDDRVDFLGNLTLDQYAKLSEFFDTIPQLQHTVELKCPECGHIRKLVFNSFEDFF